MCRHLAYVGDPVRVGALLVDPPHALVRQSWAPRRQRHGTVNADGFGIGWYVDGFTEPARHRGAGPVWADETFADLARAITARALLAAVRSGTPGMTPGVDAAAPLRRGRWLFSHNGGLDHWPKAAEPLASRLAPTQLLDLEAHTDSALLWALTQDLLQHGRSTGSALAEVVALARSVTTGRFNLLLTDGAAITATTAGDTLSWRVLDGEAGVHGVVVASEPYDDHPGWRDVPDDHLVHADRHGAHLTPL
jgi:glutamine amidotransferase